MFSINVKKNQNISDATVDLQLLLKDLHCRATEATYWGHSFRDSIMPHNHYAQMQHP